MNTLKDIIDLTYGILGIIFLSVAIFYAIKLKDAIKIIRKFSEQLTKMAPGIIQSIQYEQEKELLEWDMENRALGNELGYPKCCIDEFCENSPAAMKQRGANDNDRMKFKAGCIDKKFTGFIPCIDHARQILNNEITLNMLISNRNPELEPFPLYGRNETDSTLYDTTFGE